MWFMKNNFILHNISLKSRNYIYALEKKIKENIFASLHFYIAVNVGDIYLNVLSRNDINLLSAFI